MIEWAEHEFRSRQTASDGASIAEHLESGREQLKGIKLKTLAEIKGAKEKPAAVTQFDAAAPEFPYPLLYLWDMFIQIGGGSFHDEYGAPIITWSEIRSWVELTNTTLEVWEVTTLVTLANVGQSVFAKAYTDRMKQKHG